MRAYVFSVPEVIYWNYLLSANYIQDLANAWQNTVWNLCLQGTPALLVKEKDLLDNYQATLYLSWFVHFNTLIQENKI